MTFSLRKTPVFIPGSSKEQATPGRTGGPVFLVKHWASGILLWQRATGKHTHPYPQAGRPAQGGQGAWPGSHGRGRTGRVWNVTAVAPHSDPHLSHAQGRHWAHRGKAWTGSCRQGRDPTTRGRRSAWSFLGGWLGAGQGRGGMRTRSQNSRRD